MTEKEKIKELKKLHRRIKKITPPSSKQNYIIRWIVGGIIGLIGLGGVITGGIWVLIYSALPMFDKVSLDILNLVSATYLISIFVSYLIAWILRGVFQEHTTDTWIWRKGIEETKALIASCEHNLSLLEYREVETQKLIDEIHRLSKKS